MKSSKTFPASSIFALAVLGVMAACDRHADSQAPGSSSVQDSSGVSIISNEGPDRTLEPEEVLRIGSIHGDPDVQFDGIAALEVDAAGGVWVCDSHQSIRYYDSTGVLERKLGGRGEGPGEAPSYWGGLWLGESSILTLSVGQNLQVFGFDGEALGARSYRYRPLQQLIPMGPASGEWVFRLRILPDRETLPAPETWVVGRGPGTRSEFDSLFVLQGAPLTGKAGGFWMNGSFFDGTPSIGADGTGRVFYSDPFQYRIEVYSSTGQLERIVQRRVQPTPYTEDLEEGIEGGIRRSYEILALGTPNRETAIQSRVKQALPVTEPPHLPILDLVLVSRDGHIWAQRVDTHPQPAMRAVAAAWGMVRGYWLDEWKAPRRFDLFSPTGEYRGTTELPSNFHPMAVTDDRAYGFLTDSLDVQYVTAFSVRTGG